MRSFVITAIVVCALPAFPQSQISTKLSGTVMDAFSGAVIPDAEVNIHRSTGPLQPSATDMSVHTASDGRFSAGVTPGSYLVCVRASGFVEACGHKLVTVEEQSKYIVWLELDWARICILSLGEESLVPVEPIALSSSIPLVHSQ
jgi:hypothetical protein